MNQNVTDPQIAALAADPLRFIGLCWPKMRLYTKQRDVLQSVQENFTTLVHAANQTGKTRVAALAALWFFASRTPARVIISSSSEDQLRNVLWAEIRQLIDEAALPLPFQVRDLSIRKLRAPDAGETLPGDYLLASVTNTVESFQGHHLANDKPRVLCIFDEASAVPDEYYEAAQSWAHRMLVIGNPLSVTNFFYRNCKAGDRPDPAGECRLLRKVVHIDGADVPNVELGRCWREAEKDGQPPLIIPGLLTYQDYLRREAEWDEVQRTTRLYGRFYEGDLVLMFPPAWLDAACDRRRWLELNAKPREAWTMGVDVAYGGRDKSCWTIVDQEGVIKQIVRDTPKTTEIGGLTIELIRKYNLFPRAVAMDAGGGGKQIADFMYERGCQVQVVNFGEAPTAPQGYRNRRAEMFAHLRERIDPDRGGFALPPNANELRQELAVLPLSCDSEGRLLLPPKDCSSSAAHRGPSLRQLLGRSPDRADSLALAVWALGRRAVAPTIKRPLLIYPGPEDLEPSSWRDETTADIVRRLCREMDAEDDYGW